MNTNRNYTTRQRNTNTKESFGDEYPVFFAQEDKEFMEFQGILSGKQHLNLSQKAHAILMDDLLSFQIESLSSYVNLIFQNYYELAESSISRTLNRIRQREESLMAQGLCTEENRDILLKQESNNLLMKVKSYPKGVGLKIYLNKHNTEILEDEFKLESTWYDGHPMRYFKCVIEEYAEKNRLEREAILFRDEIERIQYCQEQHLLICLATRHHVWEVKPYQIIPDYNSMHYYLVGVSRPVNTTSSEDKIASFRISRLKKVRSRPKSYRSGKLTNAEQQQVLNRLQADGVQFLIEPRINVKLRLSARGMERFHNQAHIRPSMESCIEDNGTYLCSFSCTETQIRYYFFQFGPDVEILEPLALRDFFRDRYKTALALYED